MSRSNSLTGLRGFLLLAVFLVLFILLLKTKNLQTVLNTTNDTGFKVYNLLLAFGFNPLLAKFITAQAAHESANFTSLIFKQNNNCFGYGYNYKGGDRTMKSNYFYYESLEDCVADYTNYWSKEDFPNFDSVSNFVAALSQKNYFTASQSEYENGVTHFYQLYFPQ
jgi:hypothetical protein